MDQTTMTSTATRDATMQVMPGQMVAPGGAPPPQQAVLVQGQVRSLLPDPPIPHTRPILP